MCFHLAAELTFKFLYTLVKTVQSQLKLMLKNIKNNYTNFIRIFWRFVFYRKIVCTLWTAMHYYHYAVQAIEQSVTGWIRSLRKL